MSIGQKDEEEEEKEETGESWAYHHHAGPVISVSLSK
jgi:hypothetical protein